MALVGRNWSLEGFVPIMVTASKIDCERDIMKMVLCPYVGTVKTGV